MFIEIQIPDSVISITDDVFIYVNSFHGYIVAGIPKFKKYRNIYYPSSEGNKLLASWIKSIRGRKEINKCKSILRFSTFRISDYNNQ